MALSGIKPTASAAMATTPSPRAAPLLLRHLPILRAFAMPTPIRRRHLLLVAFLCAVAISPLAAAAAAAAKPSYADHCGTVVPESAADGAAPDSYASLQLQNGYFSGGDSLLGRDDDASLSIPRTVRFRPRALQRTRTPGVVAVRGTLLFRGGSVFVVRRNFTRGRRGLFHVVRPRGPAVLHQQGRVSFDMAGFWSGATGRLCMVGPGFTRTREGKSLDLSAVLKLNYPKSSNITSSLVTGTLESLDSHGSPNYFDHISLLAYSQNIYNYTLIPQAIKMGADLPVSQKSLGLGADDKLCSILGSFLNGLRLVYGSHCHGGNCTPFGGTSESQPNLLSVGDVQCSEDGKLHMYVVFSDGDSFSLHSLMQPERMLVGEGLWDQERNHLSVVACRVMNFKDSLESASVGDCTIGIRLWFPEALTIENRSPVAGRIWSNRSSTDPGYFETIAIQGLDSNLHPISGLRYEYTKVDLARKSCERKDVGNISGKRFPDGKSVTDLSFDVYLRDPAGETVWAYANPVSIGDKLYGGNIISTDSGVLQSDTAVETKHNVWNISYKISSFYNGSSDRGELKDISAEGIYDEDTGTLCLIGCRGIAFSNGAKKMKKANPTDCQILINVQLSPLDPEAGDHLNGTIRSTRDESDPLYFKPLEISSYVMYKKEAVESVWRMDVEITMVLISLTLSCVFIGLQLYHVKKNPDVLPSTSITMLVVLTLGHMIPLVLNFEALFFMNRNKQNVLLWSGGWLEVNEVIVRLITMVAFLLQFRFLQLAWSARSAEGAKKGLWVAERKALQLCLPLYFIGLLIAWFVHLRSYEAQMPRPGASAEIAGPPSSVWEDLISYAGLVLDGFLLPQILLNVFWNSKERVLLPAFYGGTTIVRALPHIYDAYRARHYAPHINSSYIYASPQGDFYSSAWDIIIPCEGLLCAVIIYLQQRFGGSCILPPRFRNPGGYETVPVVSS